MDKFTGIDRVDRELAKMDLQKDEFGNTIYRGFLVNADRYLFDFNLGEGWKQFDTQDDASYLGRWTNKAERQTLAYVEGDVYFVQCKGDASYDARVRMWCEDCKPGAAFVGVDKSGIMASYEDRREHFIHPDNCPNVDYDALAKEQYGSKKS